MLDPLLSTVIGLCLALLFSAAALTKLANVEAFRAILSDYDLLPRIALPAAARLIPALEAGLALAWLLQLGRPFIAVVTAGVLFVYAAALAINLVRGRIDISCGCSFSSRDHLSWWLVARNVLLALAALLAGLPDSGRSQGAADYALAAAAAFAVTFLYLAAHQLITNATSQARWRDADGAP
jgi:hypothetical protein